MRRTWKVPIASGLLVVLVGSGVFIWLQTHRAVNADPGVAATAQPPSAHPPLVTPGDPGREPVTTAPRYPMGGTTDPQPISSENAEAALVSAMTSVLGEEAVTNWILTHRAAHRVVLTVEGLGSRSLPVEQRLVRHVEGSFMTTGDDAQALPSPGNAERYQPLIELLQRLDLATLVRQYTSVYPTLQAAYRDLGYPHGFFNDRLVEVIDLLLKTPEPKDPPLLYRPGVMYRYVDEDLESLTAGQKILLRVGPNNEQIIKQRLRELRALVTQGSGLIQRP